MGLFSGLFGRKAKEQANPVSGVEVDRHWNRSAEQPEPDPTPAPQMPLDASDDEFESETAEMLESIDHVVGGLDKGADKSVNIWDLDDGAEPASPAKNEDVTISPVGKNSASARSRRNRTRLIGFDKSDGDVVDLFDDAPKAAPSSDRVQFPVGWILVMEGPGRGYSFPLVAGMSQIGRGEDQAISLDFGDSAISRNNHAAIVYDPAERTFLLGHGGKANIVRLNDKPVISNEALTEGDMIQIGETKLMLRTLCGADFDWTDTDGDEEQEDVAIA